MPRQFRSVLAIAAVGALAFAACGSDDGGSNASDDVDETPSGSIVVYSGRNEALIKPILDAFTAETGVQVQFRAGDSGELAAQLLTEDDASPADVFFSQDAGALGAITKAGLFDELPPRLLDPVPARYRATDGTWVGVSGRIRVIAYNPTLVSNPPDNIDALLEPTWKGKIGFAPTNASWQAFVTGLRVIRGEVAAERWLRGFAANNPVAFPGNAQVRDAVSAGQIQLGLTNHYYVWAKIATDGQDKVVARNKYTKAGDPGGLVNVAGVGILSSSDNKPAARALVAFLLSEQGQKYFAEKTFEYPLTEGVEPSVDLPALESLNPPDVDLSDLDSLARTQELLQKVGLLTR